MSTAAAFNVFRPSKYLPEQGCIAVTIMNSREIKMTLPVNYEFGTSEPTRLNPVLTRT